MADTLRHECECLTAAAAAFGAAPDVTTPQGARLGLMHELSTMSATRLLALCRVDADGSEAAAAAGRVLLPLPSAEVEGALVALAALLNSARETGEARRVGANAARAAYALAFQSPRRAAQLAARGDLMRALAGALGVRAGGGGGGGADGAEFVQRALTAATEVLVNTAAHPDGMRAWCARGSGAGLRALAAAVAGALTADEVYGALDAAGTTPRSQYQEAAFKALCASIRACPERDRPGLRASLATREGFAALLGACVARGAAALPPPRAAAAALPADVDDAAALMTVAALCGDAAPEFGPRSPSGWFHVSRVARLEQPAPSRGASAVAAQLLAAAPDLAGRVVDVITAGAPWYSAVAVALGPAGSPARGVAARGGAAGRRLVATRMWPVVGFVFFAVQLWSWAVSALELLPPRALAAGGPRGPAARLVPALLGLAEAAQAFAGALPGQGLDELDDLRGNVAVLAAAAVLLVDVAAKELGGGAAGAAVLGDGGAPGGTLAALVRLSVSEPPLLAAAGGGGNREASALAGRIFYAHVRVRLTATQALFAAASRPAVSARVAALLAASPALLAGAGAAVGVTQSERRFTHDAAAVEACVVRRRGAVAALLTRVAAGAAEGGGGGGSGSAAADASSMLRGLAA